MARLRMQQRQEIDSSTLVQNLVDEFNHYNDDNQEYRQPLVSIEQPGDYTHLTVIWDVWAKLSREERSQIIMEAYKQTHPVAELLNVSAVIGLTQDEAIGLGIPFERAEIS